MSKENGLGKTKMRHKPYPKLGFKSVVPMKAATSFSDLTQNLVWHFHALISDI